MGWTYGYDWHSAKAVRDDLRRQLGGLITTGTGQDAQADAVVRGLSGQRGIVKDALVAYGHRYYAAYQPGDGSVTIAVCLLNHGNDRGEPGTDCWGYKDMDESMGPCDFDCPLSILDLATDPAPNEWAREWRTRVRAYWAERREATRRAKQIAVGSKVYIRDYDKNPYTVSLLNPLAGFNAKGERYRIPRTRIERVEAPA